MTSHPRSKGALAGYWTVTMPTHVATSPYPAVEFAATDDIGSPARLAGGRIRILSKGRRPIALAGGVEVRPATPVELRAVTVH